MKKYKNIKILIIYLVLIIIIPRVPILELIFQDKKVIEDISLYLFFFLHIIIALIIIYTYKDEYAKSFKDLRSFPLRFLIVMVLGIIVIFILNIVIFLIITKDGSSKINSYNIQKNVKGLYNILYFILVEPLNEEIFFRRILIGEGREYMSHGLAFIIASFYFGFIHINNSSEMIQIIPYFVIGVVFGVVYLKSKYNILYSISLHVLNNLIGIILINIT